MKPFPPSKVIIAGSRDIHDRALLDYCIRQWAYIIKEVVSGGASGVDSMAEAWAAEHDVPVRLFPADWDRHGRKAGPIRNAAMANYAQGLIAIWDGNSRGTKNMISEAKKRELPTLVWDASKQRFTASPGLGQYGL